MRAAEREKPVEIERTFLQRPFLSPALLNDHIISCMRGKLQAACRRSNVTIARSLAFDYYFVTRSNIYSADAARVYTCRLKARKNNNAVVERERFAESAEDRHLTRLYTDTRGGSAHSQGRKSSKVITARARNDERESLDLHSLPLPHLYIALIISLSLSTDSISFSPRYGSGLPARN